MPAFPDITLRLGDGLMIGPFVAEDAPRLVELVTDPEIRRWLPLPDPYTRELAESWCTDVADELRRSGRGLIRAVRRDDELAGCIDVKRVDWRARTAELGYWTAADHRGRGVTTSVVDALSRRMLVEEGFQRIELRVATGNHGSLRVAERAGFHAEGVARNAGFTDAGRVDLAVFSRVPADLAD